MPLESKPPTTAANASTFWLQHAPATAFFCVFVALLPAPSVSACTVSSYVLPASPDPNVPANITGGLVVPSGNWLLSYGVVIERFSRARQQQDLLAGNPLDVGPPFTDGTGANVALGRVQRIATFPSGSPALVFVTETQIRHLSVFARTVTTLLSSIDDGAQTFVSVSESTIALVGGGCFRTYAWSSTTVASLDGTSPRNLAGTCGGETTPSVVDLSDATGIVLLAEERYVVSTTSQIFWVDVPSSGDSGAASLVATISPGQTITGIATSPPIDYVLVSFANMCIPGQLVLLIAQSTMSLTFGTPFEAEASRCASQAALTTSADGDPIMALTNRETITFSSDCYTSSNPTATSNPAGPSTSTPPLTTASETETTTSPAPTTGPVTTLAPPTRSTSTGAPTSTVTASPTTTLPPTTSSQASTEPAPTSAPTQPAASPTVPAGGGAAASPSSDQQSTQTMIIVVSVVLAIFMVALVAAVVVVWQRRGQGRAKRDGEDAPESAVVQDSAADGQQRVDQRPRLSQSRFPPPDDQAAHPAVTPSRGVREEPTAAQQQAAAAAATAAAVPARPLATSGRSFNDREMDPIPSVKQEHSGSVAVHDASPRAQPLEGSSVMSLSHANLQSVTSMPAGNSIRNWEVAEPPASTADPLPAPSASISTGSVEVPHGGKARHTDPSKSLEASTRDGTSRGSNAKSLRQSKLIRWLTTGSYQKTRLVGRGANGSVYAVMLKDGSAAAMKEMQLLGGEHEIQQQMRAFEQEVALLEPLSHPNIVKHHVSICDRDDMVVRVFMELVTGGSLGSMVRAMPTALPEATARKFVHQIVTALAYIHERSIVHRDLKCDNVLIDSDTGNVKLADFGTARVLDRTAMRSRAAQTMIGTPYFMAPEILGVAGDRGDSAAADDRSGYGTMADIWSLGVLTAEMLDRGNPPWPSFTSPAHAFIYIADPSAAPVLPEGLSAAPRSFIEACMQRDPRARPDASDLLNHPWLQDFPESGSFSGHYERSQHFVIDPHRETHHAPEVADAAVPLPVPSPHPAGDTNSSACSDALADCSDAV